MVLKKSVEQKQIGDSPAPLRSPNVGLRREVAGPKLLESLPASPGTHSIVTFILTLPIAISSPLRLSFLLYYQNALKVNVPP